MPSFQTEQLRTFLAVLDHGTFEAAAQQLHVTPSAISQRIKAMEGSAGQVLLQRTTPILPTPAGTIVHRLARQLRQLEADAATELGLAVSGPNTLTVVVNADSLATWFLDALELLPGSGQPGVEVIREDEQHSVDLLRSGIVMAAVTATEQPVQGCSSTPLGAMTYRGVASGAFMAKWFPQGFSAEALNAAPSLNYDRCDTLQSNFTAAITGKPLTGPRHFLPDTLQLAEAVSRGVGWGLMPEAHCRAGLAAQTLVELVPGHRTHIPLYWQRWKIQSAALDLLSTAVRQAAALALP
ncbi:LysR family transcriptional regulator ArgP [Arthrobacter psychrochitiniphilus]|uniref:ArgP/LysG family DNA-binding transcriptional regulator n=1 Tax=Arthrobacter psychrochitiniphilus TaxID=291045 RepID=A0A2V3DRR9_9MICC|nr:LysR family transcriptional regulator ArgP [Arthrobacter psychrochitiniphilus]NYG19173.1 LysR family transcriptional regulator (chromosome initiation inhibitor) [Arthrobacter psychrochitiniphilus]PXA65875.1 ArgP/LysG family DNA-binding transcriptional regulator [Arthrobacter psychrochitiniphilus]